MNDPHGHLRLANAVRKIRTRDKRDVEAGDRLVETLLAEPAWANATVFGLLLIQRRWGPGRARRFIIKLGISEWKTCGKLTDRQRHAIADQLQYDRVTKAAA